MCQIESSKSFVYSFGRISTLSDKHLELVMKTNVTSEVQSDLHHTKHPNSKNFKRTTSNLKEKHILL